MIRLLAANGCSHTRGAELEDPANQAWPAVAAQALGVPHVNLARDGASNRRIVRTTVARLPIVCADAGVEPHEVLVVIAWTDSSRHEYYVPGTLPQPPENHAVEHNWEDIGSWRREARHRASRAFYDHLWSEEGQATNLFLDWLLLDRFLASEGYAARYVFAPPQSPYIPEPARRFADQLDARTTFGGVPPAPGSSFLEIVLGRDKGTGGHPLADSHALFGRMVADWIAADGPSASVDRPQRDEGQGHVPLLGDLPRAGD